MSVYYKESSTASILRGLAEALPAYYKAATEKKRAEAEEEERQRRIARREKTDKFDDLRMEHDTLKMGQERQEMDSEADFERRKKAYFSSPTTLRHNPFSNLGEQAATLGEDPDKLPQGPMPPVEGRDLEEGARLRDEEVLRRRGNMSDTAYGQLSEAFTKRNPVTEKAGIAAGYASRLKRQEAEARGIEKGLDRKAAREDAITVENNKIDKEERSAGRLSAKAAREGAITAAKAAREGAITAAKAEYDDLVKQDQSVRKEIQDAQAKGQRDDIDPGLYTRVNALRDEKSKAYRRYEAALNAPLSKFPGDEPEAKHGPAEEKAEERTSPVSDVEVVARMKKEGIPDTPAMREAARKLIAAGK